jgi:pilus assembly protein FimV
MAVTDNNSSKFKKCALALAVASCMSLATTAADAAGLGKLTVFSSLGQPLKAEVEIAATGEELVGMTARLAPPDVFKQAGVDYASSLSDLRFVVEKRANGKSVLKLSSLRPVNEPFLDFLVELNWPAGRLVREYTFLLDPPEFAAPQGTRSSVDAKLVETVRGGAAVPEAVARPQRPARDLPAPVAPVDKPAPAKPAAAADGATRLVEKGDTLRKIAAERQYAGVSLEQMLVGLYRNNREAFIENDIHRLKAGAILNIPDAASVAAVSDKEARQIYVSSGDFSAYRRKMASAASNAPARDDAPAAQSTSGRITPKIDEKLPSTDSAKDQVKVARADAPGSRDIDRIAAEKALQESQARVTQLEKNLGELQKLLEMKNQRLAELEKPAAPVEKPAPAPLAPVAPVEKAAPPVEPPPTPAPVVSPAAPAETAPPAPAPVEQKPVEPAKPTLPPVEPVAVEEPGMLDALLEDPLPLAGGAGAIALLAGLLLYRRRKGEAAAAPTQTTAVPSPSSLGPNSVFRMTGGQSVDTGSTPPHTGEFSQAGPGTIDTDEVDPVAEADVYMAYGRDAQAEEILLEAMQKDPNRLAIHAKLLEIYANRRSLKQFETLAGELYAQSAGLGPEWEKVAALGAEIDPGNPLYGGASLAAKPAAEKSFDPDATVVAGAAAAAAAALAVADVAADQPTAEPVPTPVFDVPEFSAEADPVFAEALDMPGVASVDALPVDEMSLDFDLGDAAAVATAVEAVDVVEATPEAVAEEPYVDTVVTAEATPDALDFDLSGMVGGDTPADVPAEAEAGSVPVVDLATLDLAVEDPVESAGDADATPDFSPEGTLVISGGPGFGQAVDTDFSLDDLPSVEETPVADVAAEQPAEQTQPVEPAVDAVPEALPATSAGDDLSLEIDAPDLVSTVVNPVAGTPDDMDFDVKLSDSVFLGQPMMASEFDIGAISLDLSEPPAAEAAPADVAAPEAPAAEPAAPAQVHDAHWEEVNTKLDLAKAYEEMGDLEGARELLQEVLGEGSPDLVEQAQAILGRIGG